MRENCDNITIMCDVSAIRPMVDCNHCKKIRTFEFWTHYQQQNLLRVPTGPGTILPLSVIGRGSWAQTLNDAPSCRVQWGPHSVQLIF